MVILGVRDIVVSNAEVYSFKVGALVSRNCISNGKAVQFGGRIFTSLIADSAVAVLGVDEEAVLLFVFGCGIDTLKVFP